MANLNNMHDYNMQGYASPAHFFVPAAFECVQFVSMLAGMRDDHDIIKDNAFIDCVFGNVTTVWNGGRTVIDLYLDKHHLVQIHDFYANAGIPVRFVCTNEDLNEHDLYDRYANFVMDIFSDVPFEVVVKDPRLEEYLRGKYTNAQFISSTTKCISDLDAAIEELKKDYKYVSLDYHFSKDIESLKKIPGELRGKVELLVNETCDANCKLRQLHYKLLSEAQHAYEYVNLEGCPKHDKCEHCDEILKNSNYVFNHQIDELLEYGFNHFKLQGRINPTNRLAAELMPYLIKPQMYTEFIGQLPKDYNNFLNM